LKELGFCAVNPGCYRNGEWVGGGEEYTVLNPHNNKPIAKIRMASAQDYEDTLLAMESEKKRWMTTPAPVRGEIVR